MDREMKIIKLKDYDVKVISNLNWGEKETIQAELIKGAKINDKGFQEFDTSILLATKYKACEIMIKEIKGKDNLVVPYSKEWMNNLSASDGDALIEAMNVMDVAKKKD